MSVCGVCQKERYRTPARPLFRSNSRQQFGLRLLDFGALTAFLAVCETLVFWWVLAVSRGAVLTASNIGSGQFLWVLGNLCHGASRLVGC